MREGDDMDLICAVCKKIIEGGLDSYVAETGKNLMAILPTHESCTIKLATLAYLESVVHERRNKRCSD